MAIAVRRPCHSPIPGGMKPLQCADAIEGLGVLWLLDGCRRFQKFCPTLCAIVLKLDASLRNNRFLYGFPGFSEGEPNNGASFCERPIEFKVPAFGARDSRFGSGFSGRGSSFSFHGL